MSYEIRVGDALATLRAMPSESVHCCVTSPPYWGLRDYGVDGQIGLEASLGEFLDRLVDVFDEVRRVLRIDGTCWVNMGDCYVTRQHSVKDGTGPGAERERGGRQTGHQRAAELAVHKTRATTGGLGYKNLIGQPWRLAFALQDAGWILRQDIIWHKKNPMPESCTDRPTRSHEYLFLLTKSTAYHYDAPAIFEMSTSTAPSGNCFAGSQGGSKRVGPQSGGIGSTERWSAVGSLRNRRTVWNIATKGFRGAHFATFPPKLVEPCILAGCPVGGVVIDPFTGSGTTGEVALQHGRRFLGIELNPAYADLARGRCEAALRAGHQHRVEGVPL